VEIDLGLRELWRRKWLVIGGALVAAAVAAGAASLAAPRVSTSTLVRVGRVMGDELDDAFAVAQTVNSPGFQAAARQRAGGVSGTVTAEALTGGQGRLEHPTLVRITATSTAAEPAIALGNASVAELVARHAERFDASVAGFRAYEKVLASTGEPAAGAADPSARKELYELRAKLEAPVYTAPTAATDPFPPAVAQPKNAALAAGVAFAVSLAILVLLVLALAQVRAPRAERS